MKGLETGRDKIQKICDSLRKETLEPAKQEAREMIENAHMQAAEIISDAQKKADLLIRSAEIEIEEKKRVCKSSLNLACRLGVEKLKQTIEKELFNKELGVLVQKEMSDEKVIAHLLNGFMKSMEEKGIEDEFVAVIPKDISPRAINELLVPKVLAKLQNQSTVSGDFVGGLKIRLKEKQVTIDITDDEVRDLVAQYIRRDLREFVFHV